MQYAATTAHCPVCDSVFYGCDQDEDGYPYFETTRCADPTCEVRLCGATCQELSFQCDGCGHRFCDAHQIFQLDTDRFCATCFLEARYAMLAEAGCTLEEAAAFIQEVA